MRQSAKMARHYGVHLHTHLAETEDEERYCVERYGRRPLALMEELEWLGHLVRRRLNDIQKYAVLALTSLDHVASVGVSHYSDHGMLLRKAFEAVCARCGRPTTVPFKQIVIAAGEGAKAALAAFDYLISQS